ncbi:MAG: transposase [Acidimicrobiales bacterium]
MTRNAALKAHVAVEPETGLVTDCDLGSGIAPVASAAPGLLDGDPDAAVVLGDSAYGSGELRASLEEQNKQAVISTLPLSTAVEGGFSRSRLADPVAGTTSRSVIAKSTPCTIAP